MDIVEEVIEQSLEMRPTTEQQIYFDQNQQDVDLSQD